MISVTVTITDDQSGERREFRTTYDEMPTLLAIEDPSAELGLSLMTEYSVWQRRFDGSEYNFLTIEGDESAREES